MSFFSLSDLDNCLWNAKFTLGPFMARCNKCEGFHFMSSPKCSKYSIRFSFGQWPTSNNPQYALTIQSLIFNQYCTYALYYFWTLEVAVSSNLKLKGQSEKSITQKSSVYRVIPSCILYLTFLCKMAICKNKYLQKIWNEPIHKNISLRNYPEKYIWKKNICWKNKTRMTVFLEILIIITMSTNHFDVNLFYSIEHS